VVRMSGQSDSLVEIDTKGNVRPVGPSAVLRLQARAGKFEVLPAPAHMVVMRALDTTTDSRACRLSGEIRAPGVLCDIVGFLGHGGWRGELLVVDPDSSRSVFFDEGHVVGAQSTVVGERLGEVLYRYGVLGREAVTQCSDAAVAGGIRFGEAAVKLGVVSREKLFELTARQIEEIFYGALLVSGGMFYFLESFDETALSSRQKLSVAQLVREGVRRMHETRFFRTRIPSPRHLPTKAPGMSPPESDALGVFAASDGRRSVADLCKALGQSEFEVCRAAFQLVQSGHLVVLPPKPDPRESTEVANEAIALVLRELDAMDAGDAVREQLAVFAHVGEIVRTLLAGAGPTDDGTLRPAKVAENSAKLPPEGQEEVVAKALYEYASYALFLARPHLHRAQEAQKAQADPPKRHLSQRVTAMLEPIAPSVPTNPLPAARKK
jgi:hypothetical protein